MSYRTLDLTTHTSLSPIWRWFTPGFVNYKKGCIRLAVDQLLAHGRWFTPGTPASSTTKTGRHDIAEILLELALNTINKSINQSIVLSKSNRPMILLRTLRRIFQYMIQQS
jgi:hypothetical protein